MPKQPPREPSPHTTTRYGTAFWVLFWSLALLLASWQLGSWEADRAFPNQQPVSYSGDDRRELQLRASRGGHYLANGTVNGRPVRLLIDTGATQVAIPATQASMLGLHPRGSAIARTANGQVRVQRTRIERLSLGPIELENVSATLMPDMEGPILLGMSALRQLQLNQHNGVLTLVQGTP